MVPFRVLSQKKSVSIDVSVALELFGTSTKQDLGTSVFVKKISDKHPRLYNKRVSPSKIDCSTDQK